MVRRKASGLAQGRDSRATEVWGKMLKAFSLMPVVTFIGSLRPSDSQRRPAMKKIRPALSLSFILLFISFICTAAWGGTRAPTIASISPASAVAGTVRENLIGTNFNKIKKVSVYDCSTGSQVGTASVVTTGNKQITVKSTLPTGRFYFKVTTAFGTSNNSPMLTLPAPPTSTLPRRLLQRLQLLLHQLPRQRLT